MALDKRKTRKKKQIEVEESRGELAAFADNVKKNPLMYAAAAVFVVLCIVAAFVYQAYSRQQDKEMASQYARALEEEDPALIADALDPVAVSSGSMAAEALYMMGEQAFRAKDYEKAKAAFEGLRAKHSGSVFVPDAVEGLGFVAEETGNYEEARAKYQEILDKWPNTFTAKRQHVNLGRAWEGLGKLGEALAAYKEQTAGWPESNAAGNANAALARLEAAHPELFPEEPVEEPTFETPGAGAAEESPPEAPEPAASGEPVPPAEPAVSEEPAPAAEPAAPAVQ